MIVEVVVVVVAVVVYDWLVKVNLLLVEMEF
jgi:hypothetical protein